jgi:hypothetical protein
VTLTTPYPATLARVNRTRPEPAPRSAGRVSTAEAAAQTPRVSYRRRADAAPDDPKKKQKQIKNPQENAREHSTRPPVPSLQVLLTTRRFLLGPPRRLAGDPAAWSAEVGRLLPFPAGERFVRAPCWGGVDGFPCSRSCFTPPPPPLSISLFCEGIRISLRSGSVWCAQWCRTDLFLYSGGLIRWLLLEIDGRKQLVPQGFVLPNFPDILGVRLNPHARRHCELLSLPNCPRNYASFIGAMFLLACFLPSFFGRVAGAESLLQTSFFFLFLGNELNVVTLAHFVARYICIVRNFLIMPE